MVLPGSIDNDIYGSDESIGFDTAAVLIPELDGELDKLVRVVGNVAKPFKRSTIVVVAEGETPGGAFAVAERVRREIHTDYRVTVLGHVQRGRSQDRCS
jgi:6-phosphofructokinase